MTDKPAPIELPPKYYLDYFQYVLRFVKDKYQSLLNEEELEFLARFELLSEDAQCLFIRFSNRRGAFFKVNTLNYAEIEDIPDSLNELLDNDFAHNLSTDDLPRLDEILDLLTKNDLLAVTAHLKPEVSPLKSIKKPDLVRWLLFEYNPAQLLAAILPVEPLIKVDFEVEVMMMKFLFFGNRYDDMTEFVIRDLGHVKFQSFQEEQLAQRFKTRKEVDDTLMVSLTRQTFEELKPVLPAEDIFNWFMNWQAGIYGELSEIALPSFGRLVLNVGAWIERMKLPSQALICYQLTSNPPSRERRARLLLKMNEIEEAQAICQEMADHPLNADERFFAIDFYKKLTSGKKRAVKSVTEALNIAETVSLPIGYRYRVEFGAVEYYRELGWNAMFSENETWRALFGLLFWDIIYDTNVQAIHHPLQRVPSDFFSPDFYFKRKLSLETRLESLNETGKVLNWLQTTYEEKFGMTNVLVNWYPELLHTVMEIAKKLTSAQLQTVMLEMAANLKENTRGFPDLFIWNDDSYHFIEIKSPTDHLSSQQLHWQHIFAENGIRGKIVRIKWLDTLIVEKAAESEIP